MRFTRKIVTVIIIIAVSCFYAIAQAGYYEDAYTAYKAKKYQEAIEILEEGVAAAPNDEKLTLLLGQTYFKIKNYAKAGEKLKRATLLDPEIDTAYYLLGLCYTLNSEDGKSKPAWFEASQAFEKAVQLRSDRFAYLYQYGHSLLELKKYQDALDPLVKAYNTEQGSRDYKTIMDLGLTYLLLQKKTEAKEMLEKAASTDPKKYQPLIYLGNLYLENEEYDEVKDLGEKLRQLKPSLSTGYIFQGVGALQTKNYTEAKQSFEKAVELDSSDASAHYHLGLALEGLLGSNSKSYQSLINSYGRAVSISGDNAQPEWQYRLGHAYELESHLDWDRAQRNAEASKRCLRNLRQARSAYTKAGDYGPAQKRSSIVNERIRQLEIIQ